MDIAPSPQYDRYPLTSYNPLATKTNNYGSQYCLSWIKDSQMHREDLMARQMRRNLETKWSSRWQQTPELYH